MRQVLYPRPQLKRSRWRSLDGIWMCNGQEINVPYPPQAPLSGFTGEVPENLHYELKFILSDAWRDEDGKYIPCRFDPTKERMLLHFGAVDQLAIVTMNGQKVGSHEGGYLAFTCDVTDVVHAGENTLEVLAIDSLSKVYPYGKQRKDRGGMWYTPVSGIWKTVWMEIVPKTYVEKVKIDTQINFQDGDAASLQRSDFTVKHNKKVESAQIRLHLDVTSDSDLEQIPGVEIAISQPVIYKAAIQKKTYGRDYVDSPEAEILISEIRETENLEDELESCQKLFWSPARASRQGDDYVINVPNPRLWSPDHPYLYHIRIRMGQDLVHTYVGLRNICIHKDGEGTNRVWLNEKPIFMHGVLDQGYWQEGIYLPNEPEEYERDIQRVKELGMNFIRKHIKVESELFYAACDRLGILVMQDMVNNGPYHYLRDTIMPTCGFGHRKDTGRHAPRLHNPGEEEYRRKFFEQHMIDTVKQVYNHPSIIAYTIFNEAWGQFDSDRMYDALRKVDSTRLIDSTSGWYWQKKSDFDSYHLYLWHKKYVPQERPLLLSECGGYRMLVHGHTFHEKTYGYGKIASHGGELSSTIQELYDVDVIPRISEGMCGCIYTQLSDVEEEVNGIYTYDRAVCKVHLNVMHEIASKIQAELHKIVW